MGMYPFYYYPDQTPNKADGGEGTYSLFNIKIHICVNCGLLLKGDGKISQGRKRKCPAIQ